MATMTVQEVHRDKNPELVLQALELMGTEVWGWRAGAELDHAEMKHIVTASTNDGELLAAGAIMLTGNMTHGHISELATHPLHRGEGLGRRVLTLLETVAREAGALQVSVTPHTDNAEGFFRHLKYHPEGLGSNDLVKEL
jgi:ribosomal protein S18 acetylase RimI-like enzyme